MAPLCYFWRYFCHLLGDFWRTYATLGRLLAHFWHLWATSGALLAPFAHFVRTFGNFLQLCAQRDPVGGGSLGGEAALPGADENGVLTLPFGPIDTRVRRICVLTFSLYVATCPPKTGKLLLVAALPHFG